MKGDQSSRTKRTNWPGKSWREAKKGRGAFGSTAGHATAPQLAAEQEAKQEAHLLSKL